MRLFEATGVGAFLLTDFKDNLHTLFAPDRDVAVWRSIDDCLAAIDRAIGDDDAPRGDRARRPGAEPWRSIPTAIAPPRSWASSKRLRAPR